jgi:hypothetical protein
MMRRASSHVAPLADTGNSLHYCKNNAFRRKRGFCPKSRVRSPGAVDDPYLGQRAAIGNSALCLGRKSTSLRSRPGRSQRCMEDSQRRQSRRTELLAISSQSNAYRALYPWAIHTSNRNQSERARQAQDDRAGRRAGRIAFPKTATFSMVVARKPFAFSYAELRVGSKTEVGSLLDHLIGG